MSHSQSLKSQQTLTLWASAQTNQTNQTGTKSHHFSLSQSGLEARESVDCCVSTSVGCWHCLLPPLCHCDIQIVWTAAPLKSQTRSETGTLPLPGSLPLHWVCRLSAGLGDKPVAIATFFPSLFLVSFFVFLLVFFVPRFVVRCPPSRCSRCRFRLLVFAIVR